MPSKYPRLVVPIDHGQRRASRTHARLRGRARMVRDEVTGEDLSISSDLYLLHGMTKFHEKEKKTLTETPTGMEGGAISSIDYKATSARKGRTRLHFEAMIDPPSARLQSREEEPGRTAAGRRWRRRRHPSRVLAPPPAGRRRPLRTRRPRR